MVLRLFANIRKNENQLHFKVLCFTLLTHKSPFFNISQIKALKNAKSMMQTKILHSIEKDVLLSDFRIKTRRPSIILASLY